jgi:hypothetical protein
VTRIDRDNAREDDVAALVDAIVANPEFWCDTARLDPPRFLFGVVTDPMSLFWRVEPGGFIYFNDVRPGFSAKVHFARTTRPCQAHDEALRFAMRQAVDLAAIHKFWSMIPEWAPALRRAARRFGFVEEGFVRDVFIKDGAWRGAWLASVLAGEL